MDNLEKRIRSLEELVFKVVLETKAETMAIRDILMERNLVSSERWDELVKRHKTSYDSFKVVTAMEKRHISRSPLASGDQGTEEGKSPYDSSQGSGDRGQEK